MTYKETTFQTGGGGTNFEQSVQAAYLTTLIIGGEAPLWLSNKVTDVSFQNKTKGYETDDLLVITESNLGKHKLVIQIKHHLSFSSKNNEFKKVINEFWIDFQNNELFNPDLDRLIVIKSKLTQDEKNNLLGLISLANAKADHEDFFLSIVHENKINKLSILRNALTEVNGNNPLKDSTLWKFIKCLQILEYDFLNEGSIHLANFLNLINLSKKPNCQQNNKEIWNNILALASSSNPKGGSFNSQTITDEEVYKNFSVEKLNPHYKAITKIESDGNQILKIIKTSIGNSHFELERTTIKDDIVDSIRSNKITIITGKAGSGKSALIKNILNEQFKTTKHFVFKAEQFDQPSLTTVFGNIGIFEPVADILSCLALIPEKVIYIDSFEKLLEASHDTAFKQLLEELKTLGNYHLVVTSRKYAVDLLLRKFGIQYNNLNIVQVPDLNEDELLKVEKEFPELGEILQNKKIKDLLSTPSYLSYAIKTIARKTNIDLAEVSTNQFKNTLWNSLVANDTNTKNGIHIDREKIFISICKKRAKEMRLFVQVESQNSSAIQQLVNDEIIRKESSQNKYTPSHDILEDWALVRFIQQQFEESQDVISLVSTLGNQPAIRRSFRLWVEDKLDEESEDIFELLDDSINNLKIENYWLDEILTALFLSKDCQPFFNRYYSELKKENGSFLKRCLHILKTCCKESHILKPKESVLIPVGSGWRETLSFISAEFHSLNAHHNSIFELLTEWHYAIRFNYNNLSKAEIEAGKEVVFKFIAKEELQSLKRIYQEESYFSNLISIAFTLSPNASQELTALFGRAFETIKTERIAFHEQLLRMTLWGVGNHNLSMTLPDIVIKTAWSRWLSNDRKRTDKKSSYYSSTFLREESWGIKHNRDIFPSGIYKTPLYNLLHYHTFKAVKFICEFLNHSIKYYSEADFDHNFHEIKLELSQGHTTHKWASVELWKAHRGFSVTNYLIESILMSLEKYLLDLASAGKQSKLKQTIDYILKTSNNVSTTSVICSVSMAYPFEVGDSFLPILTQKEFFFWDLKRQIDEYSPLAMWDQRIPFAQKERIRLNNLPHRKKHRRGLLDFVIDYQINVKLANEGLYKILDQLIKDDNKEDTKWTMYLEEMDFRNYRLGEPDIKQGTIPIFPNYSPEVSKLLIDNQSEVNLKDTSAGISLKIGKHLEQNQKISLSDWSKHYSYYREKEDFDVIHDRPITLASLGFRDLINELNREQKIWCIEILIKSIHSILKDVYSFYQTSSNNPTNPMEKMIAICSFHYLLRTTKEKEEINAILELMIHTISAPLAPHEAEILYQHLRSTIPSEFPEIYKRFWLLNLAFSAYKHQNPYFLDDHDTKKINALKLKEIEFIKSYINNDSNENFTSLDFDKTDYFKASIAFAITPFSNDFEYQAYVEEFLDNFLLAIDKDELDSLGKYKDVYESRTIILKSLVYHLSYGQRDFTSTIFKFLINTSLENTGLSHRELFKFIDDLLTFFIYEVDKLVYGSEEERKKKKLIDRFWELWAFLAVIVEKSPVNYFSKHLLLGIEWNNDTNHWIVIEDHKAVYKKNISLFGSYSPKSIINVFSSIGNQTLMPQGINWLVPILENSKYTDKALLSPYATKMITQLYQNNIDQIRKNQTLMKNYIWILDKMVDLGISEAYFIRENAITYKFN